MMTSRTSWETGGKVLIGMKVKSAKVGCVMDVGAMSTEVGQVFGSERAIRACELPASQNLRVRVGDRNGLA